MMFSAWKKVIDGAGEMSSSHEPMLLLKRTGLSACTTQLTIASVLLGHPHICTYTYTLIGLFKVFFKVVICNFIKKYKNETKFLRIGSYIAQAGSELSVHPGITLTSWSSCIYFLSAGFNGVLYHTNSFWSARLESGCFACYRTLYWLSYIHSS